MARPSQSPKSQTSVAVAALRESLGDTMESFAARLGVALNTVSRWENSRPPTGKSLEQLHHFAKKHRQHASAKVFAAALERERLTQGTRVRLGEIGDPANIGEAARLLHGLWIDAQDLDSRDIGMRLGAVTSIRKDLLRLADLLMIDGRAELTAEEEK